MTFSEFRAARQESDPELDRLTGGIIAACIEVHRELGPGLDEVLYEGALCREFDLRGIEYERQVLVDVVYKGKPIGKQRIDLIVENRVILELKSCDGLTPVHRAQAICYLRLKKLKVALLVNFNAAVLHDGIKRVVLSA